VEFTLALEFTFSSQQRLAPSSLCSKPCSIRPSGLMDGSRPLLFAPSLAPFALTGSWTARAVYKNKNSHSFVSELTMNGCFYFYAWLGA